MKFIPIKKIIERKHHGKVYDLTVKNSHSYNVNGIAVHNSSGGSLVAYAAGITGIDPLEYNLLFERFLNPNRQAMPDIDADFCYDRGNEVFQYLIDKYQKDFCCNVATFGRMQLRMVIKDIAKAMGIPFDEVNAFTRSISMDIDNVEDLLERPEYNYFTKKYPELFVYASRLEGTPRHVGQHPAGICIAPVKVTDLLPVFNSKATDDEGFNIGYLSQFAKEQCELAGVNKSGVYARKLLGPPKAA